MTGTMHRWGGAALVLALTTGTALAQDGNSGLEDRVRAIERTLGINPAATATLEQRVQAIEAKLAQTPALASPSPPIQTPAQAPVLASPSPPPAAPAVPSASPPTPTPAPPPAPTTSVAQQVDAQDKRLAAVEQKVGDTTISGRMYWDVSNISQQRDGVAQSKNGWGFDAKRFYITIDHRFNDIFSADVTTDFNYVSADGQTQLFIKKAYLQATLDPALIIRAGSSDVPWIPFNEGLYGYRYVENVLEERVGFGSSADWGLHAFGNLADGLFGYQVSVISGGGYKKLVRSKEPSVEGRVNVNYKGFTLALGYLGGSLGQNVEGGPHVYHIANRFDALAAYSGMGIRAGVQYMHASNFFSVTSPDSDSAEGYSVWGSYNFTPRWAIFGRYDWAKPSREQNPDLTDNYFNLGITYSPARIVDFSLTYKNETVENGFWSTTNGVIGGLVNAPGHSGTYHEIGLWSDFQW